MMMSFNFIDFVADRTDFIPERRRSDPFARDTADCVLKKLPSDPEVTAPITTDANSH